MLTRLERWCIGYIHRQFSVFDLCSTDKQWAVQSMLYSYDSPTGWLLGTVPLRPSDHWDFTPPLRVVVVDAVFFF